MFRFLTFLVALIAPAFYAESWAPWWRWMITGVLICAAYLLFRTYGVG